uniref:Uncharacterized protein n=1 Tax=Anguilla anguilla TaxID=7936 RepID=A0A0E9PLQ9_ANGAN
MCIITHSRIQAAVSNHLFSVLFSSTQPRT